MLRALRAQKVKSGFTIFMPNWLVHQFFAIFTGNCGKLMELTNSGWRPANLFYTLFVSQKEALRNLRFTKLSPKFEILRQKVAWLLEEPNEETNWRKNMTGVLVMLANMSQQKFVTSRIFLWPYSFIIRAKRTKLILARIFVAFVDILKNVNKAVMRVMARHGWPGSSFQDSRNS